MLLRVSAAVDVTQSDPDQHPAQKYEPVLREVDGWVGVGEVIDERKDHHHLKEHREHYESRGVAPSRRHGGSRRAVRFTDQELAFARVAVVPDRGGSLGHVS
jgi:hypothetical protein